MATLAPTPIFLLAGALSLASCGGAAARGPNVLLISVDSLRADRVGAYGHSARFAGAEGTTPTVDALAADGVCFEEAVSTSSWTLPAHAALLTGLPDALHGLTDSARRLDPGHLTLAELYAANGWRTGGFWSGVNLHPAFGFSQGFERYENCSEIDIEVTRFASQEEDALFDAHEASHDTLTSAAVVDATLTWVGETLAEGDAPFFAFVHLWDPHYDYLPPENYAQRFDPGYTGAANGRNFMNPRQHWRGRDMEHVLALYDAEIRYTDDQIARLLDGLEALGEREDTLVVFTADHGDEFYEHGKKGHQRTLYEEVVRVPLVISWPGVVPAGVRPKSSARLQDVYTTLAGLCGLESPTWVEGRDLRPAWELASEGMDDEELAVAQHLLLRLPKKGIHLEGLRDERYKVLWDHEEQRGEWFDLVRDPFERQPRAFESLDAVEQAPVAALRSLMADIEARANGVPSTPGLENERLPASVVEELERLGYL